MATADATVTRSKTYIYLIGNSLDDFSDRVLPTSRDVLRVYFHYHKEEKLSQKEAIKVVFEKVYKIWARARIPTGEERNIIRKFEMLLSNYRNICRNKKRAGPAQTKKETDFEQSIDLLFDMSHYNVMNMIKIEEDRVFLEDQRSERKYAMAGVDIVLSRKEKRKELRDKKEEIRRRTEESRNKVDEIGIISIEADDSKTDEAETDVEDEEFVLTASVPKPKRRKTSHYIVTPEVAAALDRTNVSNRKAAYIISAAVQSYSQQHPSELSLSVSTISRSRSKHRLQNATDIKTAFSCNGPLVVHFDGKLLPSITGGPLKEDRIAILVTGYDTEKLLAVPKASSGTGEVIAKVTLNTLADWNLCNKVVGMSFDTTAANTGLKKGACVLLENKLETKLLWLPCRHHTHEIICGEVFKKLFGATSGPNVLLFKRFQDYWPQIKPTSYKPCSDNRLCGNLQTLKDDVVHFAMDMLLNNSANLPREDYKELLELTLIFLGETPPAGVNFRMPGAFHHARWMAKVLYVLKLYLFQDQIKLTKKEKTACLEFSLFVSLVYVKAWMTCSNSCNAPINDLKLLQVLSEYSATSDIISSAALNTLRRHLWYLSQELVPLGIFSDFVTLDTKRTMAEKLKLVLRSKSSQRHTRYTGQDDLCNVELDHFIGPASELFFKTLRINTEFFKHDALIWPQQASFQDALRKAQALRVVNDCAERGIALATQFNSTLTRQEEEKQFVLQMVEAHRKRFPNAKKSIIFRSNAAN
jgi:hypothetical protein